MKAINLKESITLQNISGEAFVLKSDGSLAPLHAGMNINTGTIIVLTDNGTISAIDKAGAPAELSYELIQNIQLPTSYEHIFSVTDDNAIGDESIHIAEQTTAAIDDLQKIHDAILDGIDPTKVQQATAAGNENSSNWGVVTIDYDNDKMLAEAGFDTAYQPGAVEYPEDYSGLNDHLSIEASIAIDSISQDDVVTAAESNAMQTITGTVGGDVKAGDIVTVTLDGKEIGKATVVNNNGKLEWSLDVDGKTLLQAGVDTVSATVTATDDAGNSATANTTHDYTIDIQASITIDPITGDNVITQQEGHEPTLPITGTVGKDVLPGDTVTVTINGNEYTTTVQPDMSWTVNVTGHDILHADKATASVTTNYGTNHEATATDTESYEVTIEAKVTIETIAGDGVVNQEESEGKVPVTGTVGGDVKEGDTVTITVNGKDYTTTVGKDGSWTVDVDGSDLVENGDNPIHATVTTCDGAGHCATADNDKGYDIDTDINAQITIDSISQDDVVTAAESHSPQTITGTVGGDVKAGDIVTVTLDGKEIGKATVVNNNGKLEWSLDVDGKTLLQAGVDTVSATVTATDDAGNSATANTTHDYTIDIQASITIDPITGDNVITQQEGHEPTLPITGTVGKDVLPGDTVTVTINGNEYTTTVQPDMSWTVNVTGDDILHADKATASVTTNYGTNHEATATDTESYEVTIEAKVTIETIAGDGVVNQEESEGKVPVTGTVGGDVKEGDTVTITVNGKDYTTTVGKNGSWTVDVDGSDLVENGDNPIHATVTTCDGAGHCATADNDKGYDIDTDINADITIAVIAEDDVINEAEAEGKVSISGTVGGDVKEGDTVTLTLDGKEIGTATVEKDANGKLVWTATNIDGKTLADADLNQVTASVTATDDAGNSKTATTTHDYKEAVLDVTVDITSVAEDNVLNTDESTSTVAIKGTVGGDAKAGDMVTVTLDGKELGTATVVADENGKLEWTLEVDGSTLAGATVNEVEATITISDEFGNTASDEDKQDYLEKDLTVSVDITSVAEDNVLNADESTSTVAIKGTVGGDAKAGDMVTVTLDGKELGTATVVAGENGKLEWTLEVEGSTLAGATVNEVEATIIISDDYGNTATAEDKQDYQEKDLTVSVDITSVAEDNVLNADESTSTVAIKGTVDGDAKAGDMVTVTLDGKELGTATVVAGENGKLEWTLEVDGSTLAGATVNEVEATITISDEFGNTASDEDKQDYLEKDLKAEITITSIAGDNALNATEVKPGTMVEIKGTVGGDVKAGDTVVVTVDGVKHEVTVNDDLEWTLEIDGSVLAGAKKPVVTADVVIKDKYGNTATATDKDDYIIPTLDVTITIDSVNGGEPITGEEHDANTPIKVTGSVGGDAKEGDTVTLHIGENTVETTVIVLENGELGYIVDVPAGMFEPDSNDGFSGDITADITINDKYGNTASANDEKDFDTIGSVITGSTSGDDLHGTGYNDLIIGDVYIESKNVNVNLVLDISGSMSVKEVNVDDIHLDNNHKSGTLTLTLNDGREQSYEFGSMQELASWLNYAYGSPLGLSRFTPELKFTFPDGSKQIINNVYDDIGLESRIDLAKNSVLEIVENYGESLDAEQLRNLEFSMITFATGVDAIKKFHWDFDKNTLVSNDGQTIADFLTTVEPLSGDEGKTDYDSSVIAALNGFTNTNTSNVIYFVTDGMDTVDDGNGKFFDKNAVINSAGGSIDKYKPTIVPVAIGGTINNTPEAHDILNQIASLGQGYKPDNTGNSQVIISTNTAQLGDVVNESFDNIISGNDTIHGGKGNDFIVGDTLNNDWLVQQYGSGHTHMADLIDSGVTLSEVLFTVAAKEQGVDIDKLTTKDVYQFVIKHQDTLVIEGDNPSNGLDKIFGDEGQDILFGSGNNDILTGGTGDDLMFGQNGDDILVSDSGSDILFGGKGNDIFKLDVLATDEKTLTSIQDFEKGDSINIESILDANLSLDDLLSHVSSAEVDGKDVNIVFDDKHKVELKDIKNVYSELGTSTSEIVTQLFNNDVFTNHH
ncbi:retention module-containing protein [Photobacterium leiognathi]|uniref:retention module-containing protein n=1 Tax=Photobacterium leiognathi TaxID=553611 RepID=UPI002981F21B|nr:retention module-containing protein [Photobacterium leiognathi]